MRWRLTAALGVVLAMGLASRRVSAVPAFIEQHAGDTLWATAVVLALAIAFRLDPVRAAGGGLAIAACIELSQLWKPRWLDDLRDHDLAALVLGRGWLWGDLVRYAVGAACGYLILHAVAREARVAEL